MKILGMVNKYNRGIAKANKELEKNGNPKALNYMRFIEEWGSGLKRVNEVLGEYGIKKVAVNDAGFAVRMNVYRNTTTGGEVADSRKVIKEYIGERAMLH